MKITLFCAALALALVAAGAPAASVPSSANVVLVHGSFADGSGWQGVAIILKKDGFNVSVVQEPETSFAEDVKATSRVIEQQVGPTILVGHSYGGAIITEAGNNPKVVGLVYIAAFEPDAGESVMALSKKLPAASSSIRATADGFLYLDRARFHTDFAADLPAAKAEFMAASQVMTAAPAFGAAISSPAWKDKPSWAVVATKDRAINPDLERFMSKRAGSTTIEIKASHSVYISHAQEVAKLIERAAKNAAK